jgi:hypothetical protein
MSVSEYSFLAQTVLITTLVRVGLWLLPFRKMQKIVNRLAGSSSHNKPARFPSIAQIARTVTVASRYVPAATCLTQALTTQVLLGRYGYPSTLRIGVARSKDGHFQAHAWVESDGRVVIGGAAEELAQNYAVFPAIDGEV